MLERQPSTGCLNPGSLKYKRQASKQSLEHVRLAPRSVSPSPSAPTTARPTAAKASGRAHTGSDATLDEETRAKLILELQKRYLQKTLGDRHVDGAMPYVPSVPSAPSLQPPSASSFRGHDMDSNPDPSAATMGGVAKHHIFLRQVGSNERLH